MGVNLEVPLEMITRGVASSSTSAMTFYRTSMNLDMSNYDGVTAAYFEIIASNANGSNSYAVELYNGTDASSVTTITSQIGDTVAKRYISGDISGSLPTGNHTYYIKLPQTANANDLKCHVARIIIVQQNATKTRIQQPALCQYLDTSVGNTDNTTSGSSNSATYGYSLTTYSPWTRNDDDYYSISKWDFEVVMSADVNTAYCRLYNETDSAEVYALSTSSTTPVVLTQEITNDSDFHDGDTYRYELKLDPAGLVTQYARLYSAFIYVTVDVLQHARVWQKIAQGYVLAAALNSYGRAKVNTSSFSNGSWDFRAWGYCDKNATALSLMNDGTNDSGTGGSSVQDINWNSGTYQWKTYSITPTDGNRYWIAFADVTGYNRRHPAHYFTVLVGKTDLAGASVSLSSGSGVGKNSAGCIGASTSLSSSSAAGTNTISATGAATSLSKGSLINPDRLINYACDSEGANGWWGTSGPKKQHSGTYMTNAQLDAAGYETTAGNVGGYVCTFNAGETSDYYIDIPTWYGRNGGYYPTGLFEYWILLAVPGVGPTEFGYITEAEFTMYDGTTYYTEDVMYRMSPDGPYTSIYGWYNIWRSDVSYVNTSLRIRHNKGSALNIMATCAWFSDVSALYGGEHTHYVPEVGDSFWLLNGESQYLTYDGSAPAAPGSEAAIENQWCVGSSRSLTSAAGTVRRAIPLVGSATSLSSASATGKNTIKLIGASTSVSITTGNPINRQSMVGTSSSLSSASGALPCQHPLLGASTSLSSASGSISGTATAQALIGASTSLSSASAAATNTIRLLGAATSLSSGSGAISGTATAQALAGSATSLSSAAANATNTIRLLGAATSLSSGSGAISGTATAQALIGASTSLSSASGAAKNTIALIGAATSLSSGAATLQRAIPLAGSALSISSGTGDISGTATSQALAGASTSLSSASAAATNSIAAIGASSSLSGASATLRRAIPLAGSSTSLSSGTADISGTATSIELAGAATSVSSATAAAQNAIACLGSSLSLSSGTGAISGMEGTVECAGASTSLSSASATLVRAIPLAGAATSLSSGSADISGTATIQSLAGDSSSLSSASATLRRAIPLEGASTSVSSASADISGTATAQALAGESSSLSSTSATLVRAIPLAGAATSLSSGSASISGTETAVALAGASLSLSSATGEARNAIALIGSSLSLSSGTGSLTGMEGVAQLQGAATSLSSASATATNTIALSGAALSLSSGTADISGTATAQYIGGDATSLSSASATLVRAVPLAGSSTSLSGGSAEITGTETAQALAGSATSLSSGSASLGMLVMLSGSATSLSGGSATLSQDIHLFGSALSLSSASGLPFGYIGFNNLRGSALSLSSGRLEWEVISGKLPDYPTRLVTTAKRGGISRVVHSVSQVADTGERNLVYDPLIKQTIAQTSTGYYPWTQSWYPRSNTLENSTFAPTGYDSSVKIQHYGTDQAWGCNSMGIQTGWDHSGIFGSDQWPVSDWYLENLHYPTISFQYYIAMTDEFYDDFMANAGYWPKHDFLLPEIWFTYLNLDGSWDYVCGLDTSYADQDVLGRAVRNEWTEFKWSVADTSELAFWEGFWNDPESWQYQDRLDGMNNPGGYALHLGAAFNLPTNAGDNFALYITNVQFDPTSSLTEFHTGNDSGWVWDGEENWSISHPGGTKVETTRVKASQPPTRLWTPTTRYE